MTKALIGLGRFALLLFLVVIFAACVDTTGVYRLELPPCPVPAPVINDPQPPSTLAWGCPYQVRLADSSLITVYLNPR